MADNHVTGHGGLNVQVELHGLDNVLWILQQLPKEVVATKGGPVARALRKAALVIKKQAVANAPVRTGALRKAIIVTRARSLGRGGAGQEGERYLVWMGSARRAFKANKRNQRAGKVGKTYKAEGPRFYGRFLEYGTSNMRARPWARPAVAAKAREAIRTFHDEFTQQLERVMRELIAKHPGGLPRA